VARARRGWVAVTVGLGLAWATAGAAAADELADAMAGETAEAPRATDTAAPGSAPAMTADETASTPTPASSETDPYPSLDVPTKPWAYDTGYFFALTRGLEEEGLSTWQRGASMVGTVPVDVVCLPTAALAGLFGS